MENAFYIQLLIWLTLIALYHYIFHLKRIKPSFNRLFLIALVLKLVFVFIFPWLSDDIYRYIWDGLLSNHGVHPFDASPIYWMNQQASWASNTLYQKLNSPNYYTIYPSIHQLFFWISASFGTSIYTQSIVLKLLLLGAESLILWLIYRKTGKLLWLIFSLHPLNLVETFGNAHFETIMALCLVYATIQIHTHYKSSIALAFAIVIKLIPTIMILSFISEIPKKRRWSFLAIITLVVSIAMSPLFYNPRFFINFLDSFLLYFRSFAFNSWLSLFDKPNWLIPLLVSLGAIGISLYSKLNIQAKIFWTYAIYILCSNTIHPWYILPLVFLMPQGMLWVWVWAAIIPISYGLYSGLKPYSLPWIIMEYSIITACILWLLVPVSISRRSKQT